jgi:ER membrane protein complex subunit 7
MIGNKTILAVVIACWRLLLLASFAAAASVAAATATTAGGEPTMTLYGRLQFPDQTPYNITTKISVNHGQYTTYSRTDGHFTLYDLSPGIYLIDALSVHHHFSQIKCQYKPSSAADAGPEQDEVEDNGKTTKKSTLSCIEYLYPGAPKRVVDYSSSSQSSEQQPSVVKIHALAEIRYFEERKSPWFMISGLIKNPMLIMMVVMAGLMYMMPKLMEDMNPEERAQMKKQMAMQQDPVKMLGSLFGGADDTTTAAIESKKKSGKKQK